MYYKIEVIKNLNIECIAIVVNRTQYTKYFSFFGKVMCNLLCSSNYVPYLSWPTPPFYSIPLSFPGCPPCQTFPSPIPPLPLEFSPLSSPPLGGDGGSSSVPGLVGTVHPPSSIHLFMSHPIPPPLRWWRPYHLSLCLVLERLCRIGHWDDQGQVLDGETLSFLNFLTCGCGSSEIDFTSSTVGGCCRRQKSSGAST